MKYFLIVIAIVCLTAVQSFAANSQSSGAHQEYATVDTDPDTDPGGDIDLYGTNEVNPRYLSGHGIAGAKSVWFSIRGTGTMTVSLQFKCPGDSAWTTYESYADNERMLLEDMGYGVLWKAVVLGANYTSGSKTFGFDW